MPTDAPKPTPAGTAPAQPIGTPPGGGEWTWDAERGAWAPVNHNTPE